MPKIHALGKVATMTLDFRIQSILRAFLQGEEQWLSHGFDRILRITATRPKAPYGFEWFAHTAFAAFLLRQDLAQLSDIRTGQACSKSSKPDISFRCENVRVAIELKVVVKTSEFAHATGDDSKAFEEDAVYSLLVCYPHGLIPDSRLVFICSIVGPCGFVWNLRKIKEIPNQSVDHYGSPAADGG
jgi:hypothetical protein